LVVLITAQSEKKRYDGYKMYRINVTEEIEYKKLFALADSYSLDIWAFNRRQGYADVMISPMQQKFMDRFGFQSEVVIDDIQQELDRNERKEPKEQVPNDIFDDFPTYGEVVNWVNEQLSMHSDVAERVVIGQTYQGTDIMGVRLGSDSSKPIFYIHCTIHAREWITTTTCCWIIDNLLNTDPEGREILDDIQFIIVPVLNVDGYQYTHNSERLWRKNRAPNSGSSCIGADLNRNYAHGWGGPGSSTNPCSDIYRGSAPFSSPETDSERDFLQPYLLNGQVVAYVDIHSYGGQFMSPWGYTYDYPADYDTMEQTMISATNAIYDINGRFYEYGTSGNVIYLAAGGSDDWAYGDGGVVNSFTIECFGTSFTPPISFIPTVGREIYAGMKQMARDLTKK